MKIRRLVTGHDASGHAIFLSDETAPREHDFGDIPGHGIAQVWITDTSSGSPTTTADPTLRHASILPGPGQTSLLVVSLPPDDVMTAPLNPIRAYSELAEKLPGLFECFEADNPGMHKTPTLDYAVLLEGELWLELDNGQEKRLAPGDVVIQNGTRHAWRNKSDRVAKAVFFMVGVEQ
ncbi:cupin domain-containing protein [Halopseudomonas xiamenensis]|uniref:cupin domain-containing protein n=1 Tax=Halopseudomonas xiamenensis TaxID=157792 RepID=UPI001627B483|nr:cupin domain-containing protein [Halopseudomonas xiamenensis]